ncbi:MAG: autotransporter-associated beta strand repeat-containing protein [Kiritimatiellae bacterium]|nr:autotransporter-associated beta strand repeat-containing protein [Kiritimatiellia bacterium]
MTRCCIAWFCFIALAAFAAEVPRVVGHRGNYQYDDNAAGGFRQSLEAGVTGFETDVRMTSDGGFVIMHDNSVSTTTTGSGIVEEMTFAEVTALTLKRSGEHVPSLQDVVNVLRGRSDIFIEIEMKSAGYTGDKLNQYVDGVYQIVSSTLEPDTYVFTSFATSYISAMKTRHPEAKTGYIVSGALTQSQINTALSLGCSQVAPQTGSTVQMIQAARNAGLDVTMWMVEDLDTWLSCREKGATATTSNHPIDLLASVQDELDIEQAELEIPIIDDSSVSLWKGTVNGTWNTSTANWTVNGSAGKKWTNGADAVFDDRASMFSVSLGTTATPASTVFVNTNDYTLAGNTLSGNGELRKYGSGKLTISGTAHTFTGNVLLAGGETILPSSKDTSDITSASLGNPRVARTVVVSNATLRIQGKNPFGGGGRSTIPVRTAIKFYNSTLVLTSNFCVNAGDVYLHNSRVKFRGGLNYFASIGSVGAPYSGSFWGSFYVANLYFSGSRSVIFEPSNGPGEDNNAGFSISKFARQGIIDVPDMTRSSSVDVSIRVPIVWSSGSTSGDPGIASGFRKTGAGTLELNAATGTSAANSTYTGDVDVVEGTLRMAAGRAFLDLNRATTFGAAKYPHTVTVHPGATLELAANDTQGQFYNTNNITIHVKGGTLSQGNNLCNGLGRLILENATLRYNGLNVAGDYFFDNGNGVTNWHRSLSWPTFGFNGGIEFRGTNTYTLGDGNNNGKYSTLFFGTDDGKPTDVFVAEISGSGTPDETPDVTFKARLVDAPPWYNWASAAGARKITATNHAGVPLNMRKTGPGTLLLANTLCNCTGRIEVAQGTLRVDTGMTSSKPNFECPTNSPLGDLSSPNLTLCVNGGTLWISKTDALGQANAVNRATIAVTNGTFRQSHGLSNPLPFLDLYDATLEYSGANTGGSNHENGPAAPWGTFIFTQRVRFDGTHPYNLQNVGGNCYFSLGWQSDSYQTPSANHAGCIEQHGKTEFYVADITQDANPDVTIGVVLKVPCRWSGNASGSNTLYSTTYFRTGLLKTGPGTLRLNSTDATHYYTEATRVNGGALLVDSRTFLSTNVIVQTGASIGGTGTVARVTIEAGGGFTAAPGQSRALTAQSISLPGDGIVRLDVPYVGEVGELVPFCIPIVTATGLENAKWHVTMNGGEAPDGFDVTAVIENGIVYGCVTKQGLKMLVY